MWGGIREREMGANGGEDGELIYQERVAVIWIEKVKSMGPGTLDGVERGRGCAQDRVILADMSNMGMFKRVNKAASNLSGTWYFSNFFLLFFTTFCVVLPSHVLFSQFHSSRKDKTRAIDPKT